MTTPRRTIPLTSPWTGHLAAFRAALLASGRASSANKHVQRVARLALDSAPAGPWDLSRTDLERWLDQLGYTGTSRTPWVSTLRLFYDWALTDGRTAHNPAPPRASRPGPKPSDAPPAWMHWLDLWALDLRAGGYPETTVTTRLCNVRRMARRIGTQDPAAVTSDMLVTWLALCDVEIETRRSYRSSVRKFYEWAVASGRLATSPAERLPRVRPATPNPHPASERAYAAALAAADPREALMLRLAAEVGLRRGEVARVHSSDLLDEDDGWSLLVHGKGERDRVIPLPDGLAAGLRALPAGWAFPGHDRGHLSPAHVGKLVAGLLPAGVGMHALRHRFATKAYDLNRDVFTVQQLLGHASPVTTRRYVKVSRAAMRRHVNDVGPLLAPGPLSLPA